MWKSKKSRTVEVAPADAAAVSAFKRSAEEYVRKLPDWASYHLRTKPFYTVETEVDPASLLYLHDVAHLLTALDLPASGRILDVACGPGWLSEVFYRFGYDVTGVDIADDLLQIAAERIGGLAYPPLGRTPRSIRFLRLDVETAALDERFDGIVLYDCLHHFIDTKSVLRHLRAMLAPGGRLVIVEGTMPEPGSDEERNLLAETAEYGTLEAPFTSEAMVRALRKAAFATVQSYEAVDGLCEREKDFGRAIERRLRSPRPVNFVVCQVEKAPIVLWDARPWEAAIEIQEWRLVKKAGRRRLDVVVQVKNVGRRGWVSDGTLAAGNVCLGVRLLAADGTVVDEDTGRTPLGRYVGPRDTIRLALSYPLLPEPAPLTLSFDLVFQGRFWFAEQGVPAVTRAIPPS